MELARGAIPVSKTIALSQTAIVTLNADGNGTVTLGPSVPGTQWQPSTGVISVSSNNSGATQFACYQGFISDATFLGGSLSGASDTCTFDLTLWPGQTIVGVWSGGDSGATAVLSIYGQQVIPSGDS